MIDRIGRNIDYLRISVTDKCNLRCKYCMPQEGVALMPHDELLRLEEIARVCRVMARLGISKIRLTGGEPLVRKNIVKLISDINNIPGIEDIAITTNGVLFAPMAKELKAAGLKRVNLSLDTMNPESFEKITGRNEYNSVIAAMDAALANDMKLKINCVACRQMNYDDIAEVAYIAKNNPVDVRFIELMPIGCGKLFDGVASDEILSILEEKYGKASVYNGRRGNGPAGYYEFEGFNGKIGFISPMSHKFCSECNRIRLTAEGMLKLCLHYNKGVQLRELLRNENITDDDLYAIITEAVMNKPKSHHFENIDEKADKRKMYQIGG